MIRNKNLKKVKYVAYIISKNEKKYFDSKNTSIN